MRIINKKMMISLFKDEMEETSSSDISLVFMVGFALLGEYVWDRCCFWKKYNSRKEEYSLKENLESSLENFDLERGKQESDLYHKIKKS